MKSYNHRTIEKKWPHEKSSADRHEGANFSRDKQATYNHTRIESKWQARWKRSGVYKTREDKNKKKQYVLDMFPYPSGEGLHVGHPKGYIATDVYSRFMRMQGRAVLHPMGFDAFGLPAENYALQTKTNPVVAVKKNVARYKKQLELLGFDYDWTREINTTDPAYYKWTQWIFLQMFKAGLAYESNEPINWCPSCKTGLANEDVENGRCERCGTLVEKKPLRQWLLRITDYAEKLLKGLETLDWPESIKELQRNWIGKSEGSIIKFQITSTKSQTNSKSQFQNSKREVEIFTTRADTLFGATYLVLAPENPMLANNELGITNYDEVLRYIVTSKNKTEIERTAEGKDKTGVELKEVKAINPANGEKIPIWVADYVLAQYGTGAIMAVPAHDERDYEFAKKYNLPIRRVVANKDIARSIVWGRDITRDLLEKIGARIIEEIKTGNDEYDEVIKKVEFPAGQVGAFEELVRGKLPVGFWNEYVGPEGIVFNFKEEHGVSRYILGINNEAEIDRRCYTYFHKKQPDQNWRAKSVWKGLAEAEGGFYKDVIVHVNQGRLENSGRFNGKDSRFAKKEITEFVGGKLVTKYKLRDWVFSRQRYWGEPIPLVFCESCKRQAGSTKHEARKSKSFKDSDLDIVSDFGFRISDFSKGELLNPGWIAVPEKDLPVKLPNVKSYAPTGTGESPLAGIAKWVNVKCPKCGGKARRETNTMPQWAGSSWYYIAYCISENLKSQAPISKQISNPKLKNKMKYWLPVDFYVGGAEHATRHLIYARFWHQFLFGQGLVSKPEPFKKLQHVGLILAEDGKKMSKRWGNVINPDDIVERFGADALRVYEMFMGPFDQAIAWNTDNLVGARRFLERVFRLRLKIQDSRIKNGGKEVTKRSPLSTIFHQTIKKVTEDIVAFKFNTAVSQLMICINECERHETISPEVYRTFLLLLAPFAPHIAEELWSESGGKYSVHQTEWPTYDAAFMQTSEVTIAVQVNGKVRGSITLSHEAIESEALKRALALPEIKKWLPSGAPRKVVYVKGKILSLVA